MFMIGGAPSGRRFVLPLDLKEFEQASGLADQLAGEDRQRLARSIKENQSAFIKEMTVRLVKLRQGLDAAGPALVKAKRK
jgi:hypothetical protein